MTDDARNPIEARAGELKQWLTETHNVPGIGAGLVGPIANFLGGASVIYRDASISLQTANLLEGRIVIFTKALVIDATITPSGESHQGDRIGVVAVTAFPRKALRSVVTSDTHVIGATPWSVHHTRWPWPITATLTYANGTTIPIPLNAESSYYSTWTTDLLPHLLQDLGAAPRGDGPADT